MPRQHEKSQKSFPMALNVDVDVARTVRGELRVVYALRPCTIEHRSDRVSHGFGGPNRGRAVDATVSEVTISHPDVVLHRD